MKGVIFTEFFELVEQTWSLDMVDNLIDDCDLPSGGSYTTVGTYDHREIVQLVQALSRRTEMAVPLLLRTYGKFLFGRFTKLYPAFFEGNPDAFGFLEQVEGYIHVEVRKLYPDAMLPTFDTSRPSEDTLVMVYRSERHLADVAHGLIEGCCEHFEEPCEVGQSEPAEDGAVTLTITRGACLTKTR